MRRIHLALVALALIVVSGYALAQQAPAPARPVPPNLPEWAWGVMPPAPPPQPGAAPAQPPADDGTILHIEGSNVGLTRTQLRYDREKQELVSKAAGLAFPIRNGVPVMLASEARPLSEAERT